MGGKALVLAFAVVKPAAHGRAVVGREVECQLQHAAAGEPVGRQVQLRAQLLHDRDHAAQLPAAKRSG